MKKSYQIGSSFHQKRIGVHRTENNMTRRAVKWFAFFCALFAPVCHFVEQVEQLQGKAVWSEFAPILGEGKKRVLGADICKGGL
mgnify:CR=1 FL=1